MKIHFRYVMILFGVLILVLIASRSFSDNKTYYDTESIQRWIVNSESSSCKPESLPESIPKLNEIYDNTQTFVMFLGYSQTIDGLVGNILDAHSEVLLPQEYDVIGNWKMYNDKKLKEFGQQKYMLFFFMHYLSNFQSIFRNFANRPNKFWVWKSNIHHIEYNYVSDLWQGQIQGILKVVGDTSGVDTSKKLANDHYNLSIFKEIQSVVGIPLKFLHIVTNPLENIAAKVKLHSLQMNDTIAVKNAMKDLFSMVKANEQIRKQYGSAVLDIYEVELLANPKNILKQVCNFLEITCNDIYLDKVKAHLKRFSTRSCTVTEWGKEERELIELEMKKYSFFEPYLKC